MLKIYYIVMVVSYVYIFQNWIVLTQEWLIPHYCSVILNVRTDKYSLQWWYLDSVLAHASIHFHSMQKHIKLNNILNPEIHIKHSNISHYESKVINNWETDSITTKIMFQGFILLKRTKIIESCIFVLHKEDDSALRKR